MLTLFNQDRFHGLNLRDGQRVVRAEISDEAGRLVGSLGGVLDGDMLTCGFSAPFGGVDFVRERETPVNVALVIDTALPQLHEQGARTIRIKLPASCYGESEPLVQFTLLNRGFQVERCELNQHIELESLAGADEYVAQLKSPARRALRGLLESDFEFARCETDAEWEQAYAALAHNRARRGRELSLSLHYVMRARAELGRAVRMYSLTQAGQVIAAALVYRVRPQRDLVVAWGDGEHALEHSPMNLLAYRVVEDALQDGVRTLDLGISNEPDPDCSGALVPNTGLVQFKQSVLARIQPRLTLVRELSP